MAKILIVDDERSIRELFRFVLEEAGHTVAMAENGRLALEAVQADPPEFILLDISMPEMTGAEFIKNFSRLAATMPHLKGIPFVVMTGENFMESDLNAIFATTPGFVCFFPKMTSPETVLEKIAEYTGS